MSNDFGTESRNLNDYLVDRGVAISSDALAEDLDVTRDFNRLISDARALLASDGGSPRGLIFIIPPGHFSLSGQAVFELPENVQLYVCPGALIRPEAGVTLVIRGSLFAGMYQIFGYDRRQEPLRAPAGRTAPHGRIVFATRLVRALYPEWWGAISPIESPAPSLDSSYALQAAIEAACVTRDHSAPGSTTPVRRPSLPVLLGGMYCCFHTLTVNDPPSGDRQERHLVLRGRSGLGNQNLGVPTIRRFRNPVEGDARADERAGDGCLLRIGPNVHFEIEDVNFGINDDLRLLDGAVDVVGGAGDGPARRGIFRRCSFAGGARYALRVTAESGVGLRQFVVDKCNVAPGTPQRMGLYGVEVRASAATMLHVESSMMHLRPTSADERTGLYPNLSDLLPSATMHLTGGSVLVRATMFHTATGPRPSRGNDRDLDSLGLEDPDGQDVFLAKPPEGRSSTHFTGMHLECQSWWFLSRPEEGDDQVVLVSVAHANVNWGDPNNLLRLTRQPGAGVTAAPQPYSSPPSVVWLKSGGRCVLIGCRLYWNLLTDRAGRTQLVDVGTMFLRNDYGLGPRGYIRSVDDIRSVARPPFYRWLPVEPDSAFDHDVRHVVPLFRP